MKPFFRSSIMLLFFLSLSYKIQSQKIDSTNVKSIVETFVFVERMPSFPGGDSAMIAFIKNNLVYSDSARINKIEGTVTTRFVVDEIGNLVSPTIIKGISPDCNKEALRILSIMPKWIPGRHNGKNVKVAFVLPIRFKLP